MAKLPSISRLTAEDFKDQKGWISKLFYPLNLFMDTVFTALNKGLTFSDNFSGAVKVAPIDQTWPVRISWGLNSKPIGVWPVSLTDNASPPQVVKCPVSLDWNYDGSYININWVSGLTSLTSGTTANTSKTISNVIGSENILIGQTVTGSGIPAGTTVTSVTNSDVTISQAATLSAANVNLKFTGKTYTLTFIAITG